MAIEIVSFPIKNGGSFHNYVSLPEGTTNHSLFQSLHRACASHASPASQVDRGEQLAVDRAGPVEKLQGQRQKGHGTKTPFN